MSMNLKDYPDNWKEISLEVRERAGWCCELCPAENGKPHWKTGSKVVLTVHHIHDPKSDISRANLISLCQRCHLRLDLGKHMKNRRKKKIKNSRQVESNFGIHK